MQLIDALVLTLRDIGVQHIFGVSGANIEHLHDAVYRLGSGVKGSIENVLCKSEAGAAFMADGQARLLGGIGVCCATSGGGMMNLAVGIAESRASNVPVLALIGLPARAGWGQGAFQDSSGGDNGVDAPAFWQALSKFSAVVEPDQFWPQLYEAISAAVSFSPGPCVLLLPRDVMITQVPECPTHWPTSLDAFRKISILDEAIIKELVYKLDASQRPLLIAGEAVDQSRALAWLAQRYEMRVVTTLAATAALGHTHPAFGGVIGIAGHPDAHELLSRADFILVVGCQLEMMVRTPLENVLREKEIVLIHHRIDAISSSLPIRALRADPQRVLMQLVDAGAIAKKSVDSAVPPSDRHPVRRGSVHMLPAVAVAPTPCGGDFGSLLLSDALLELQHDLDAFDQLFFDAGNCAATAAHYLRVAAGARSRIALGMGGMGYAICAAIGARIGSSGGRSLVICGDGAFLMAGLEIHTAIERQLPILWLVCNDSQHGMCTSRQRLFFDDRLTCSRYAEVDIWQIAQGLSASGQIWTGCVREPGELRLLLSDYLRHDRPGVLELKINVEEVPPFYPLLPLAERYAVDA